MKRLLTIAAFTLIFLGILCGIWYLTQPLNALNKVSLYNFIFPGRERLPFGENPQTAYNFSIGSLDAAFASHRISGAGKKNEQTLRVALIGDSSAWGTLLRPEETLCGQLNGRTLPDGRVIDCCNLAYPTLSLAKDYLILNRAMRYEPDLILWSMTMESFPADKQGENELIKANRDEYISIFPEKAENENTQTNVTPVAFISDQRRKTADWLRLQLYGLMWAGTGIDQDYPEEYPAAQTDLEADKSYHGIEGPLPEEMLSWDILEKGVKRAGSIPLILINEPMLISNGENSEIRYNYYYPRQAYDSWHQGLLTRAEENGWHLLDLWDSLDTEAFTNSAIHYNAESAKRLADIVFAEIEANY